MPKYIKPILIISAAFFIVPMIALAHQPRLVDGGAVVVVENPEISQAFYGELKGLDQSFSLAVDKPMVLFANILVPNLPMAKTNMSLEILKLTPATTSIAFFSGDNFTWTKFYEPFAGDDYLKGPEFKQAVEAGSYLVRVSSPNYKGKYSLAIGEKESFPINEIWNTFRVLPTLKSDFFNKSPWMMFFNYIGLFLLTAILVLAAIIFLAWRAIKKRKNNKAF